MKISCPNCQTEIEVNPAALLGKAGGSIASPAKARAARRNAKLGGWPKGKKRAPKKLPTNANEKSSLKFPIETMKKTSAF